ncbi:hypothetical protein LLE49_07815 [Alicyclobacillus tolerans]|uniref:hypothetical protein n=1 Tax=Alicyclobacillus tolerans TaxID=90970 RepID=UPI001F171882|nr:hypothetical protein [Alicyclobacillus tolerans]MCF8564651.1 hypothetical protein [Alicyclobacillus tolerans]
MDHQSVQHYLATLSYRFEKTIKDAPRHFSSVDIGHGVRTPIEIVNHMNHVLRYAIHAFEKSDLDETPLLTWGDEVECFHQSVMRLYQLLKQGLEPHGATLEQIVQGPISDAMTHVGQLALLRRMADSPISGENFMAANIRLD